jgi:hypothetical protein
VPQGKGESGSKTLINADKGGCQMQTESLVKSQIISSLEKVFADEGLDFPACNAHSMLRNEVYSFQLACRSTEKLRNVLRTTPGLYPDLLEPVTEEDIVLLPGQSRALWFSLGGDALLEPGNYPLDISLESENGVELTRARLEIEVIDALLPPQEIIHTEWLHADCLATWY